MSLTVTEKTKLTNAIKTLNQIQATLHEADGFFEEDDLPEIQQQLSSVRLFLTQLQVPKGSFGN